MPICRALLKYGYSNFKLEILEYCEPSNCLEREQYYLDSLKPEYNILKIAGSCLGHRWKLSKTRLGRKQTEETKQKIREAGLGNTIRLGSTHTEESKKRMSEAKKTIKVSIEVLDLETGIKTVYPSITEAARALDITINSISQYIIRNTNKPFKGKYKFSKV